MILEVARTPDCMEGHDTSLFDGARFIGIDILQCQAMRTAWRIGRDRGPYPVFDAWRIRRCSAASSGWRLRWHLLVGSLPSLFLCPTRKSGPFAGRCQGTRRSELQTCIRAPINIT